MDVTRREFLYCAAATTAALASRRSEERSPLGGCILLDLGAQCALRESVSGYRGALAGAASVAGSILIVPAALAIEGLAARRIVRHVEGGGTLVLESGATFAAMTSREFREHRDALRALLGLDIEAPRRLVRHGTSVPYVEFRWPSTVLVRDFGAVVPVHAHDTEWIARVDDATVAIARRRGHGTLVFLGSPIGPALWSGDAEARRWLHEVLRQPPIKSLA